MAEFSFDVVSEYDHAELTNALDQARREVGTRFDFKGTDPQIDHKGDLIMLEASTEDRAKAAYQVLVEKAARRGLSGKLFKPEAPKTVGRGRGQIEVKLNAGISDDLARGEGDSRDVVRSIMKAVKVEVQIAGGVRTRKEAQEWLDAGAVAVVMGTAAVRDPLTFHSTVWAQPGRVLAALDVKEGLPAVTGWTDTESVELETLLARWATLPLGGVILTAVERDGTLSGPDLETLKRVRSRTVLPLSYSGGIRSLDDLRALAEAGADAVIVGKALYEGQIDLKAALALV